jgi:TolB protein
MRPFITILIISIILISCNRQESKKTKYDFSYERDNDVFVIRFNDKKDLRFKYCFDPAISPDGTRLAYTKYKGDSERYIVVVDLESNIETKLKVNNKNFYGASWSPDNSYIAFNIYNGGNWQIGFVKSDNTGFQEIKSTSDRGLYEPTWTSDSKHIITHDGEKIFKYNLNCKIVDTIDLRKSLGKLGFSSDAKFLFTSNNRFIVFNTEADEGIKGIIGPIDAVFVYDTENKNTIRLSPKGMDAVDIYLESEQSILFSGLKENEDVRNIYRIDLNTKNIELILINGTMPTISKKSNEVQP